MDDRSRKLSPCGTQIDDLPSCLIMDILLRLTTTSLLSCRVVCRSWNLVFSDPLFVKHHLARSPTYLIRQKDPNFFLLDYEFNCLNSSNGLLLCIKNYGSCDEIYVCNPILGEYITIPTGNTDTETTSVLGFNSRSNQFKVLRISSLKLNRGYGAEIYTIGDGTRQWKNIGIAPFCSNFTFQGSDNIFLNGSIHWAHAKNPQIVYFNFDTEQFGSLPSPPAWPQFNRVRIIGVIDGCLSFLSDPYDGHPSDLHLWIMKEYGVEESWTGKLLRFHEVSHLFYNQSPRRQFVLDHVTYNPSFISLQDVAKGEQFTPLSGTRTMMGCSQRLSDYLRSRRICLEETTSSEIH